MFNNLSDDDDDFLVLYLNKRGIYPALLKQYDPGADLWGVIRKMKRFVL